jgi:hypothetical protein
VNPNPLVTEMIGSLVRAALVYLGGFVVSHGIWTASDLERYASGLTLILIAVGWSWWQKRNMRTKLVTAMAMPAGVSENDVKALVNDPNVATPSVTLPKDQVAQMPPLVPLK